MTIFSTSGVCWEVIFGSLEHIAVHHSDVADKLEKEVAVKIANYAKDMQKTRKVIESEAAKITKEMKVALERLQKVRTCARSLSPSPLSRLSSSFISHDNCTSLHLKRPTQQISKQSKHNKMVV